eukprot:tig00021531_g22175.t1
MLIHGPNKRHIVCSLNDKMKAAQQAAARLRADLHQTGTCSMGIKIDWNVWPARPDGCPIALITTVTKDVCVLWRLSRCRRGRMLLMPPPLRDILTDDKIAKIGALQQPGLQRLAEYGIAREDVNYVDALLAEQEFMNAKNVLSLEEAFSEHCGMDLGEFLVPNPRSIDWAAPRLHTSAIDHANARAFASLILHNTLKEKLDAQQALELEEEEEEEGIDDAEQAYNYEPAPQAPPSRRHGIRIRQPRRTNVKATKRVRHWVGNRIVVLEVPLSVRKTARFKSGARRAAQRGPRAPIRQVVLKQPAAFAPGGYLASWNY